MNLGSRNTSNNPVHVGRRVSNQYLDVVFPLHPLLRLRHNCLDLFSRIDLSHSSSGDYSFQKCYNRVEIYGS